MAGDRREFVKLDVGYWSNPKIVRLLIARRPLAAALHQECICYSRQHRTDGVVPLAAARSAVIGSTARDVAAAVAEGLLVDNGDGTVTVHDYLNHQESADEIARHSEAGKTGAAARWGATERNASGNANRSTNRNAEGEGEGEKRERTTSAAADADGFEVFWATYPRRDDRGHALKAYRSALRKTDAATLHAGAEAFASQVARERRERKFIPLAATWLNGERWGDEPPGAGHSEPDPLGREPNITELRLAGLLP